MPTVPIIKSALSDAVVAANSSATTLNLLNHFDDPFTTGLVATFQLYDRTVGNNGTINVVLFDQPGKGTPSSVENFRDYAESGAYNNSFMHRSAITQSGGDFIVQGGGFTVDNFETNGFSSIGRVSSNAALDNDYSADRANTRGTLAFAKLGGNPDSATNQWFFNTADNTNVLGPLNNGGFSVFGEVVSSSDLSTVDAIAALPRFNLSNISSIPFDIRGALSETPFITDTPNAFTITQDSDFTRYQSISVSPQQELTFEAVSNNPSLLSLVVSGTNLSINYLPGRSGSADITVRATTLQGTPIEDSFSVAVSSPNPNEAFSNPFIVWDTATSVVSRFRLGQSSRSFDVASIGRTIEDINWRLQTTGDLNGDGQDDVLLRNFLSGQNLVWYMQAGGNAIASEALIGRDVPDPNWSLSGTGDFDGDGKIDLILRNENADQIVAWYMNGDGTIKAESLVGRSFGDNNWKIEATADFNGDGQTDIVLRNALSGQNILWTMNGSSIVSEALIGRSVPGVEWQIEGARDFDNNGSIDILWRQTTAGQGLLWTMQSPTQIGQEQLLSGTPDGISQIVF